MYKLANIVLASGIPVSSSTSVNYQYSALLNSNLAATDYVLPAVEIIDSRFSGFKFDLASVVADNGSSARFVTGKTKLSPQGLNLQKIGVVMKKNGQEIAKGESSAVLGNPAEAIAVLVNILSEQGEYLPAGSFVMSGGITEAFAVQPGDQIAAEFEVLGNVSMTFVA